MKILIVSHGVINNNSGLGRVHYELKQEYEKAGHIVDKVDYSDLYPKGQNIIQRIFGTFFTKKLHAYLKINAYKYDVIDANFENITFPKTSFGFNGVLFVRSHGIRPLYIAAEKNKAYAKALSEERNKKISFKTTIGSYIRSFYKDLTLEDFNASLKHADVIHCLNNTEYLYFINLGITKNKLAFIPNGLPKHILDRLYLNPNIRKHNLGNVSFVGSWGFVKGIKDWRKISNILSRDMKTKDIYILGSMMSENFVKKDFDHSVFHLLKIVPTFKSEQLPALLKNIKVGIFASYMEGFGFAVLEQLAAGIPVVAYDVPGVSDMLYQIDPSLLIEAGKVEKLSEKALEILNLNEFDYEKVSTKCIEISKKYILEDLTNSYLKVFQTSLNNINDRL